jgi:hypothetical protein
MNIDGFLINKRSLFRRQFKDDIQEMLFFLKFVYSLAQGNTVCGNMSGQHLYVPVDATAVVDPVRLFAFVGNSGAGYRSDTSRTLRNRIQVRHWNRIQVRHTDVVNR